MINNLAKYAQQHSTKACAILQELEEETKATIHGAQMLSGTIVANFLTLLIKLQKPKLVVELGTFTGFACISMAMALAKDAHLISCDVNIATLKVAQKYINRANLTDKITLKHQHAAQTIADVTSNIDFAFVDADKQALVEYYEMLLPKVAPNGIIVIDNALADYKIFNGDRRGKQMDRFNKHVALDNRVNNIFITMADGLNVIQKI